MGSSSGLPCLSFLIMSTIVIVIVIAIAPFGASEEFKVGDNEGWHQPGVNETSLYQDWAAKNRFQVGDSLRFDFKNKGSVLVVDKWAYQHCNTSSPLSEFKNGNNKTVIINLDKPGPYYFICGISEHCKAGQRFSVDVISLRPTLLSPPPIAAPPKPPLSPSPSPLSTSAASASVAFVSVLVALFTSLVIVVSSSSQ